jgi:KaiC/GvpD/RAD55 family RecA-like ATPase
MATERMIASLVLRGIRIATATANLLSDLEGTKPVPRDVARNIKPLLKRHFGKLSAEDRERASIIVSNAWVETVRARLAQRPDVLVLTCDILANPNIPLTRDVARFAVTLGLRSLYRIDYNTTSLQQLRAAHAELKDRISTQKRARIRKGQPIESFIIDIACLDGSLRRSIAHENLLAYYQAFRRSPFGIASHMRGFSAQPNWPELHGELPDFPYIAKLAFAQPTCIPGLDDVVQGLLAAVPMDDGPFTTGGLVTLIAGAPGSGKTSVCLTLASRMAEMGSSVSYVATEESAHALRAKLVSLMDPNFLASALLPGGKSAPLGDELGFVDGRDLTSFVRTVDAIAQEYDDNRPTLPKVADDGLYLTFPRVLVIDSLTALRHVDDPSHGRLDRQKLATLLSSLRDRGICVFLVGGPSDCEDEGLAYLVDNVFLLGSEQRGPGEGHRVRFLDVYKTRLQSSYRGKHVLHLSRMEGCVVNQSLHSLTRSLHGHGEPSPSKDRFAAIATEQGDGGRLLIREHSHILVYGYGSASKARFALALALESRHDSTKASSRRSTSANRVLVVSFLYGKSYYETIGSDLLEHQGQKVADIDDHLTVIDLYPGFLDPETLVARIVRALEKGRLQGQPFTAVVIDGIHNMLVQFPLLQHEPLLWPTLYRLFRAQNVDAISTFTFFRVPRSGEGPLDMVSEEAKVFAHLLVSNCDYSFIVERFESGPFLSVTVASSLDPVAPGAERLWWDPRSFAFVGRPKLRRRGAIENPNQGSLPLPSNKDSGQA